MKRTTLCYIHRHRRWLMLYRNKKPHDPNAGKWIGIGGRIEAGETPDDCNSREVLEETGLVLRTAHFHGVIRFRSDAWEDEDMYLYSSDDFTPAGAGDAGSAVGRAAAGSGSEENFSDGCPLPECDEGELAWIDEEEMFDLPMWEGDRLFLTRVLAGQDRIEMTLKYVGDRLVSATDLC